MDEFWNEQGKAQNRGWNPSRIITLVVCALMLLGCGESETNDAPPAQMVYVDTASGEAVVGPVAANFPAKSSLSDKRTLMPGLYCSQCRQWHPAPPMDQINRQQRSALCPKCGQALSLEGPWPEQQVALDD